MKHLSLRSIEKFLCVLEGGSIFTFWPIDSSSAGKAKLGNLEFVITKTIELLQQSKCSAIVKKQIWET